MKRLILTPLILITSSTRIALSQPLQIPVIPYNDKPPHVSYKVHKRCKRVKSYWKCIDKAKGKIPTSLDLYD